MIKTYSKARDGNTKLSADFRVREFACKDGSDKILIDDTLVTYLERIRHWAGVPIVISSGYRTPSHNASIGGASSSQHTKGKAADVYAKDRAKSIYQIAKYAEAIGVHGIECNEDKNYVHLDTRSGIWRCYYRGGKYHDTSTFGGRCPYSEPSGSLRRGNTGDGVKWLQFWLRLWGYAVAVDGSYGAKTDTAVRELQKKRGLTVDGIAGEKTRKALKGF